MVHEAESGGGETKNKGAWTGQTKRDGRRKERNARKGSQYITKKVEKDELLARSQLSGRGLSMLLLLLLFFSGPRVGEME